MTDHLKPTQAKNVKPNDQHQGRPSHRGVIEDNEVFWCDRLDNLKALLEELHS